MRGVFLICTTLLIPFFNYSQVGIGTINPSSSAMLEISSSVDEVVFKGLMPQRVPSQIERDAINATSIDGGLIVFVEDTGTLEVWNGIYWEVIYTLATQAQTLAFQDFDTNLTWNYAVSPSFYSVGSDIWDTVTTLGSGSSAIDLVSGTYLGCRDLDNPNGGGSVFHEIIFENVTISTVANVRVAFDYDVVAFDNGDDVLYELFYDEIGQGQVVLINGVSDYSEEGTITLNIPGSVINVRLTLGVKQNGDSDFAGFDNFRVYGQ